MIERHFPYRFFLSKFEIKENGSEIFWASAKKKNHPQKAGGSTKD